MNNDRKEYTFIWYIENYSFCFQRNGEELDSSEFTADALEGTVWFLGMYPRGFKLNDKGYISLYLQRSQIDNGPETFPLKYELSVLALDGSALYPLTREHIFKKGGKGWGASKFLRLNEVLLRRKADYLPQDTLGLCCKIWIGEGIQRITENIVARTYIGVQRISFHHVVESFSAVEPNQRKTIQICYSPKDDGILTSDVYFTDAECCEGKIMVEITPSVKWVLSKCKLYLLHTSGNVIKCGEADNRFDPTKQGIRKLPLSLTRKTILNRKSEYLADDKLSLLCECVLSSGVIYKNFERVLHKIPYAALKKGIDDDPFNKFNAAEELAGYPSVLDDMRGIFNNGLLIDVKLKTKTKTFPAHKIVLCARSPVFKAMMSNDMREKNTDCIEIDDLDDDTVHQLLLFLYTDHLGVLQREIASKLYYAADKYEIKKLKAKCSIFLVDTLCTLTATELLILADAHNDYDLKKAVEDFILEHEEEIFGSDEWEKLIETNPQLVIKTMHLKYRRNKASSTINSQLEY